MVKLSIHNLLKLLLPLLLIYGSKQCYADTVSIPLRYYHSDHLGSASWITNGNGTPVQHLQYMPYGEPLVNERTSSYEERYTFTGKERDSETGFSYFGARYYDSDILTGWLSVDPMADKYPGLSPYAYCGWNPIKLVDPDGRFPRKGVNIYTFKANAGVGLGYGFKASWKTGIATDRKGMTHFSAVSTIHISNQNLYEGSSNPTLEIGVDIGASIGYERNYKYNTFYEASQSSSTEFSFEGKGIFGGSIGMGDDSFSISGGAGLSISASTEQFNIIQSISLSKKEAKEIGYLDKWSVNNISRNVDEKGNYYYTGTVNDSNIQVKCKAIVNGGYTTPDNFWVSDDYLK